MRSWLAVVIHNFPFLIRKIYASNGAVKYKDLLDSLIALLQTSLIVRDLKYFGV